MSDSVLLRCVACGSTEPTRKWSWEPCPNNSRMGPFCDDTCLLAFKTWPLQERLRAIFSGDLDWARYLIHHIDEWTEPLPEYVHKPTWRSVPLYRHSDRIGLPNAKCPKPDNDLETCADCRFDELVAWVQIKVVLKPTQEEAA